MYIWFGTINLHGSGPNPAIGAKQAHGKHHGQQAHGEHYAFRDVSVNGQSHSGIGNGCCDGRPYANALRTRGDGTMGTWWASENSSSARTNQ